MVIAEKVQHREDGYGVELEVVGDVITTGQTMVKAMTQASEDLYNTLSTAASRATNTNFDVDSVLMQDHSDSQSGADAQHSSYRHQYKQVPFFKSPSLSFCSR